MDGANVCRQEEVRLQHHPVDHHHRRRPPRARLFRARPAPLSGGGVRTTRRGAFWGASSLGSRTVRLRGPSLGRQPLQARAGRGAQVRRNALDERELAGYERARLRRNGGGLSARRRHGLSPAPGRCKRRPVGSSKTARAAAATSSTRPRRRASYPGTPSAVSGRASSPPAPGRSHFPRCLSPPNPSLGTDRAPAQPDLAMRMRGLEPPRGFPHTDLNRARLPIPPHPPGRPSVAVPFPA